MTADILNIFNEAAENLTKGSSAPTVPAQYRLQFYAFATHNPEFPAPHVRGGGAVGLGGGAGALPGALQLRRRPRGRRENRLSRRRVGLAPLHRWRRIRPRFSQIFGQHGLRHVEIRADRQRGRTADSAGLPSRPFAGSISACRAGGRFDFGFRPSGQAPRLDLHAGSVSWSGVSQSRPSRPPLS